MKKKVCKLILILLLMVILSIIILIFLSNKVMPIYLSYSEAEMKRVVTTVINESVTEEVTNELNIDSLFLIKQDENSKLTIVDFDPVIVNRVMSKIADLVYKNLKLIERQDFSTLEKFNISKSIFYIPTGIIFKTTLLNNLGPKIPVKLELISSVNPNIKTDVKEYGINNSLIEVCINVVVDVKMILPMYSDTMQVIVVIPLAVKLIQGEVPRYYQGGIGSNTLFFQEENT